MNSENVDLKKDTETKSNFVQSKLKKKKNIGLRQTAGNSGKTTEMLFAS